MDFRPSTVIKAPSGLSTTDLWDCLIWSPPGDANTAVIVTAIAGTNFNSATKASTPTLTVQVQSAQEYQYVSGFLGVKIYDTSSGAGSAPANLDMNAYFPASFPTAFRTSYKSLTASLTASSLNNQGTVFSTQFARPLVDTGSLFTEDNILNVPYVASGQSFAIPFDESTINLLSPGAETRPAKDGVYMPLRLNGPSQPFVSSSGLAGRTLSRVYVDGVLNNVATALYTGLPYFATGTPAAPTVSSGYNAVPSVALPLANPRNSVSTTSQYAGFADVLTAGYNSGSYMSKFASFDTGFDNTATGVILFRGLSPLATVTLQTYIGLEMIPRQDSPLRAFVRTPCPPDRRAIDLYYDIANSMPTSYPARYNSFGALLPFLVEAAKQVLPQIPALIGWVTDKISARPRPAPAPARIASAPAPRPTKQKTKKAAKPRRMKK